MAFVVERVVPTPLFEDSVSFGLVSAIPLNSSATHPGKSTPDPNVTEIVLLPELVLGK